LFSSSVLFPNVASVSGLSILDCRHLYRFPVVFCLLSSSVLFPNVASVSGLSILDCRHLNRFLCCVLFVVVQCFISQCCQCLWIVHS
jgi:hypothetical protein